MKEHKELLVKDLEDIDIVNASIPGGILISKADESFTITHANKGYFDLVGYSKEELYEKYENKGVLTLHPDDIADGLRTFAEQTLRDGFFSIQARLANKSKGYNWVHFSGRIVDNKQGEKQICYLIVDITKHVGLVEELKKQQEYNDIIVSLTNDAIFDLDISRRRVSFSKNIAQRFNINEVYDDYPNSIINLDVISDESKAFFAGNYSRLNKNQSMGEEIRLKLPDGSDAWYTLYYHTLFDENNTPVRVIGKMVDVTQHKQYIAKLTRKAEADPLTKLYNKEETRVRIEKYIAEMDEGENAALMLVDIDNFKGVNDTLGHQFGDGVLVDVAQKLKGIFRDSDIIGRIGGDEFVVFLRNTKSETIIAEKAKAITDAFRRTFSGEHNEYKISGSVGIALCPQHARDFDSLYRISDSALYQSKSKGKDCFTIYSGNDRCFISNDATTHEQLERFVASYYADDLIYNVFEMLYETKDIYTTVNMVLTILGTRYNVDRCYIFEHSDDNKTISNTYEWCKKGIEPFIKHLQNVPVEYIGHLYKHYNEDGTFCCNDIATLDELTSSALQEQGIKSILQCAFFHKGEIRGFIGFDDCTTKRMWHAEEMAALNYISRILCVFLGSERVKYLF